MEDFRCAYVHGVFVALHEGCKTELIGKMVRIHGREIAMRSDTDQKAVLSTQWFFSGVIL